MREKALIPVEQKRVDFYGDDLAAIRVSDGRVYTSLRHMCQALDIDTTGQRQRIQRQKVLNNGLGVCKIQTPGGIQETYVLRVDLVPLWLTGIRTSMVKDEIRAKLEKFQEEAATVLWEAFQDGRLTTDSTLDELLATDSDAAQAYKMLQGMLRLARHQLILESRLDSHDKALENYGERLEGLEAAIAQPDSMVTQDQASQISQAVKTVAILQGKQTKRNEFGAVYGELYRKFGITSYKMLPAVRFEEAMSFLNEWRESLGSESF